MLLLKMVSLRCVRQPAPPPFQKVFTHTLDRIAIRRLLHKLKKSLSVL